MTLPITEEDEAAFDETYYFDSDPRMFAPAPAGASSIEFPGDWREERIWMGYFDSSLVLLREIENSSLAINGLIFPALFNLRHGIEIAMKWHIRYAGGIIPKNTRHDLKVVAEALRRTADGLTEDLNYISEVMMDRIMELASIDPRAVIFRYADELGGAHIITKSEHWDLQRLHFAIEELSMWFEGLRYWIIEAHG